MANPSDAVLDMWNQPEKGKNKKKSDMEEENQSGGGATDSYAMYVRIMKSVAEIMNGV